MQQYFAKDRKDNTLYLNIEDLNHIKNDLDDVDFNSKGNKKPL